MTNIFNYTHLSTRLEKSTRTLFVTLNRPDLQNAITTEFLFVLESLLAWTSTRVEIHSICFSSSASMFSVGVSPEKLPHYTAAQLEKHQQKLQKIILSMMHLPQTIVMDMGHGTLNWASELSLGADIRIAHETAFIAFNHTELGLIAASGGISLLSQIVPFNFARSWILQGQKITINDQKFSGFINSHYQDETKSETTKSILENISKQAPVQRIQTKLALFEGRRDLIEKAFEADRRIAKAALISEDWKNIKAQVSEPPEFMAAKSMSYAVKFSLIKNEELVNQESEFPSH